MPAPAPRPAGTASPLLSDAAAAYLRAAEAAEQAATQARTAARLLQEGDGGRGAAHAFAAQGHLALATDQLEALAKLHAKRADS